MALAHNNLLANAASFISSNTYYGYVPPLSLRRNDAQFSSQACNISYLDFNTDMETDEVITQQQCYNKNNPCVITENSVTGQSNQGPNRKRNALTEPSQNKRFRPGRVRNINERGFPSSSSSEARLAALQDDSQRLLKLQDFWLGGDGGLCSMGAAGKYDNHRLANKSAYKNNDNHKEYEDMLLETHGCSIYHQQQTECNALEAEF